MFIYFAVELLFSLAINLNIGVVMIGLMYYKLHFSVKLINFYRSD